MKKKFLKNFIKSAVPEFAQNLRIEISSSCIAIYAKVKLPARNGSIPYSSDKILDQVSKEKEIKNNIIV